MTISVQNNSAALLALQNLNRTTDQLAQTMQGSDNADSSDSSSGDGSDDPSTQSIFSMGGSSPVVSQMLPQALSDGITQAGGLGIAHQLYLMLARSTGLDATTDAAAGEPK